MQGVRALSGLVIGEDQALGEMVGMGPITKVPPGPLSTASDAGPLKQTASKVDPVKTAQEIRAQKILADLARREIKFATDAAAIEKDKLTLIRGGLGVANASLDVDKAKFKLIKAQLNFDTETNGVLKERLRVKRDIAKAALDEAEASKRNAETLARQQQASAELGIRQFLQGIQLNEMQQRIATDKQVRATSPFARSASLSDPFFGKGTELQNEQAIQYTETLRVLNKQIAENNINIQKGAELSNAEFQALVRKGILLERELRLFKELQPARDAAALSQVRFAEAMALTVPVTDSLLDSLVAVVDGTKTAEQAFADFLRSIASLLMDAAKQMIAQYIAIGIARMFAGIPAKPSGPNIEGIQKYVSEPFNAGDYTNAFSGKALGGAVSAGRPYMVGERGPELFVPGAQGNIVPNDAMGSTSVVVNVDASGTEVQGNQGGAEQLGRLIGSAVQAELIKQKRPGGLLTR